MRNFELESPGGEATAFLKWAGGKARLVPFIMRRAPSSFRTYIEPFMGSASVFFALRRQIGRFAAILADTNMELVTTYVAVRDAVDSVLAVLQEHKNTPDYYYLLRALEPETLSPPERAARLIYLNKTCFNGLYRVNRSGKFNVPFGRYERPRFYDPDRLRAASAALKGVEIIRADFRGLANAPGKGDFAYCDPPYVPLTLTANFTSYADTPFASEEQIALARMAAQWRETGASVVLSNSDTPIVRDLYRDWHMDPLQVARPINSKGDRRGTVGELLIY